MGTNVIFWPLPRASAMSPFLDQTNTATPPVPPVISLRAREWLRSSCQNATISLADVQESGVA